MLHGDASRWDGRPLAASARTLRRWARAREGVAAMEFALILPLMLLMYLGVTELSFMVGTDRKVELVSRTVGDLTGRVSTVNATELLNIMNAAEAVMTPYKTTGLKIVVSSVRVTTTTTNSGNGNGNTTATGQVVWSCSRESGSKLVPGLAPGSAVAVPSGFETASSFIHTKVEMPYTPLFGSSFLQSINGGQGQRLLERTLPWLVREAGQVTWSGSNQNGCS